MAELHRGKLAIVTLQRSYKGIDIREAQGDRQGSSTVDKIKTGSETVTCHGTNITTLMNQTVQS